MDAILIAGPTAAGKSALAMRLAEAHGGVIVNADSMQVYAPLAILTARPSAEDLAAVEHRLYGHESGRAAYSTGAWYRDAAEVLAGIRAAGRIPVVVGGTGLYFRALLGGLADMPAIPGDVRDRLRRDLAEFGPARLHGELAALDPETARRLDEGDGQRIVRALEVFHATGRSIRFLRERAGVPLVDAERAQAVLVAPDRAVLQTRIADRVRAMMRSGAVEEVRGLLALGLDHSLPVMKAIGVREIRALLEGETDMATAEERIAAATRRYAKRQMTWFRNQPGPAWRICDGQEK